MAVPDATGALELAAMFRAGRTTPTEAVEHYLSRIGDGDAEVGGFVTVTAASARCAAAIATAAYRTGEPSRLGPLFGVPTAIKDLNLVEGVRTTFGSAAMRDFIAPHSDEVTLRIERAGMISLGKTNTPEFGSPCYTEPEVAPPARTPYDLRRSAGGSSGGAAAAVAADLLPVAQGSDGGGSIRIPASVCGLVGLKPSRGRVSAAPAYADVTGLAVPGPIARTMRDAAAFLDALAGHMAGDDLWAAELAPGESYLDWCERRPEHLRIARFCVPVISDHPVDPEVLAAYEAMSTLLESLGHEVVDVPVPIDRSVVAAFETVWFVSAAMAPVPPEHEHLLRPLTRWQRDLGGQASGPQFGAALATMKGAAARAISILDPYDAVLTPTLGQLPAPVGGLRDDANPSADFAAQKAFTPFTSLWNVTGMPAVSMPSGWSATGLPIGTMLAARPGQEQVLCALGSQVEETLSVPGNRWHRPPLP